jgi:hypothetical protein
MRGLGGGGVRGATDDRWEPLVPSLDPQLLEHGLLTHLAVLSLQSEVK